MARNAIYAAGNPGHPGWGILDTDLVEYLDFLCLDWVYKVLEKKGLNRQVILRLQSTRTIYQWWWPTMCKDKAVKNIRLSLRQGDLPSVHFFSYGIAPLLVYLDNIGHISASSWACPLRSSG